VASGAQYPEKPLAAVPGTRDDAALLATALNGQMRPVPLVAREVFDTSLPWRCWRLPVQVQQLEKGIEKDLERLLRALRREDARDLPFILGLMVRLESNSRRVLSSSEAAAEALRSYAQCLSGGVMTIEDYCTTHFKDDIAKASLVLELFTSAAAQRLARRKSTRCGVIHPLAPTVRDRVNPEWCPRTDVYAPRIHSHEATRTVQKDRWGGRTMQLALAPHRPVAPPVEGSSITQRHLTALQNSSRRVRVKHHLVSV
jgi:hypothetical protein